MRWLLVTISGLCLLRHLAAQELNAVYATQTFFEMHSPIIYTPTGICVESASKVRGRIQIFLPPLQDVLEWGFIQLAKNMAYVLDFYDDSAAFETLATGFTVDTAGVPPDQLRQGVRYNVTIADVSAGVQYDLAKASCHFKLGFA